MAKKKKRAKKCKSCGADPAVKPAAAAAPAVSQADGFADAASAPAAAAAPAEAGLFAEQGTSGADSSNDPTPAPALENRGGDENLDAARSHTAAEVFALHNAPNVQPGQGCGCKDCKFHLGGNSPDASL